MIAAALVAALACPAQPAIREDMQGRVLRSRVVACVGGRPVVVRRAQARGRRTGVRIWDATAAGRWIAWTELRYARGRTTGVVVAGRITGVRLRIVEQRIAFRSRARGFRAATVVVTPHGELAWAAQRRLVTARIGESAVRALAHNAASVLGVEDGRTIRWWRAWNRQDPGGLAYTDLRPWEQTGCPPRRRFRAIAESDAVLITTASYGRGWNRATAVRACLRATGADPVVTGALGKDRLSVVAVPGEWAVLIRDVFSHRGCEWAAIEVYEAGSERAAAPAAISCHNQSAPRRGGPVVVTESGVPAWIVPQEFRSALVTTADFGLITLDATGPGGLTGLVANGTRLHWLHDGEPRSMDLG